MSISRDSTWRINEDIIEDSDTEKIITEEIKKYFQENDTPELSKATIWEADKAVIRGKLISIGAGKKKERRKNMTRIIKEIHELEQRHKKQLEKETYRTLILKRDQLKEWMEQEERREYYRVLQERFKWGNKPGKYLAKMIRKKKSLNYIEKIKNEKGEVVNKTTDIALAFQIYFSSLYAIKKQETHLEEEIRKKKIHDYLKKVNLPKIQLEQLKELEKK